MSTAISSRRRSDLEPVNNECITIEYTQDRKKSIVFVCYRSPSTNVKMYLEALTKCMDKALCETETTIIIGDLNQNMLQRTTSNEIRDFADMFALKNFIKSATCYKNPENHTLVDLLLCNKSRQFSSTGVIENGLSDVHHFIFGVLSHQYIPNKPKTITYRSYKTFDENEFNKDLSETPFHVGAVFDDVEDKLWFFQKLLTDVVNTHAPIKSKRVRPRQPPFMNSTLRKNVHLKAQLRNRYNRYPTQRNWEFYRRQRNRTTQIRKNSIRNYLVEKCGSSQYKTFYKTARPFIVSKQVAQPPVQLQEDENVIKDEVEIANIMNSFYTNIADNIGEPIDNELVELSDKHFVDKCIEKHAGHSSVLCIKDYVANVCGNGSFQFNFDVSNVKKIEKCLLNLNVKKSTGYDKIAPKILKTGASNLASIITVMVNDMFETSSFPEQLKRAEIQPLHKKGSRLMKANYRPVSILTSLSKIFEKEIEHELRRLGDRVFSKSLSAYRKNYCTQDVLVNFTECIKRSLDNKLLTGAVLTDLSKAFDSLPHDLVIAKMGAYGVEKEALVLIASYLRGRSQRVKVCNERSQWLIIKKGVPQGSIVGPILFNFFVNDLLFKDDRYDIANYADDTTIYVSAPSKELFISKLTSATNVAIKWFVENGMQANASKFDFIVFGNKCEDFCITLCDGTVLHQNDYVTLLGVVLDHKLDYSRHISNMCKKAAWQLCALGRLSKYLSVDAKMTIFRSFIVSNLTYCKLVWHFCNKTDEKKLEKLQERGLRIVSGDYDSDYVNLLKKCNLTTLAKNRILCEMVEVYKARKGISPGYICELFRPKTVQYNLVRGEQLIVNHKNSTKYGLNSFSHDGAARWNKLKRTVKDLPDVKSFKKEVLKSVLINVM